MATQTLARFAPARFTTFRFLARTIDADGEVALRYALDDELEFTERISLPLDRPLGAPERERLDGLLALLHWVAGVSYFKTAAPPEIRCEAGAPGPATADLLEALYSEGLGEFAYTNRLASLPRPRFPRAPASAVVADEGPPAPRRVLVPVGGGKDSIVALEVVARAGVDAGLFSVGAAPPIERTVAIAGLPWLQARRVLDPKLGELNRTGALNGHVPVTAIVTCIALLAAAANGYDAVAMANERSASSGNVEWGGVEVNHQFSKGLRAERLLSAALREIQGAPRAFSVLRPASELAIARAFARLERYHAAFTSCNAIFRLDPELRAASWCCECPKCRFVYLVLAPFSEPQHLRAIFGRDLLGEEHQRDGFALLTATGGHKPFECVGEERESAAALGMLAEDPRWRDHSVVRALAREVPAGDPASVLALSDEHDVPPLFLPHIDALLGA
ncbi:MAG TPA: hypothetical protein VHT27_01360 [Solirubrobacteraceae bacterium]|jgi:hypothetical protein|nr:hypothetical protein [Solirubrobacteraceae bacterium]